MIPSGGALLELAVVVFGEGLCVTYCLLCKGDVDVVRGMTALCKTWSNKSKFENVGPYFERLRCMEQIVVEARNTVNSERGYVVPLTEWIYDRNILKIYKIN